MFTVSIIGAGNVASHLIDVFDKHPEINVLQCYSRSTSSLEIRFPKVEFVHDLKQLQKVDVIIIAVNDTAIETISNSIFIQDQLIVHTSGSMPMEILQPHERIGVFYPLQTFSKNKAVDFNKIPICVEAHKKEDEEFLYTLGKLISNDCQKITSTQRKALHVAAVFVNNFTNHLYTIGNEICEQNNLDFNILTPLIEETTSKIKSISPLEAQTGPAKRHDQKTIEEHLHFLKTNSEKNIYKLLTLSIQEHVKKL